eukprot:TRINITY_DN10566_c0_g1_i1.p3 TRINITY_DN10566_c0_g1~~TRINITY_DN10566_c0_g1_i1.p3  ORF type:complete len:107 (+),score=11.18 TRINITY_DN10566_c0_g1_i1:191-511(+)
MNKNGKSKSKYYPAVKGVYSRYPQEFYYKKNISKIERINFSNYQLNCPFNSEEYLTRTYGEEWKDQGCTQILDHQTFMTRPLLTFSLSSKFLEPAQPFYDLETILD